MATGWRPLGAAPRQQSQTNVLPACSRQRGMTQVAEASGLSRESLYRALSADGNPEFRTIVRVMQALGLRLRAAAA